MDWLFILTLCAVVALTVVVIRRRSRIRARNETHGRLMNLRLEDLPVDEHRPLRMLAEAVGLDWGLILDENKAVWDAESAQAKAERMSDARRRQARDDHHLLEIEQQERARQQRAEDEAIASILAAMDDPDEIRAFKRERGL